MTNKISFLLLIFAFTGFTSCKTNQLNHSLPETGMYKVAILYPNGEDKTFDMDYYEKKHMPMVAAYLGTNLVKYTIEKGVASGIPNQPLPYLAIGTFYVKNLNDYQAAIAPNREAIRADFPNYTNATPVILVSEVVR